MADLHATYNDAKYMYDFLEKNVCPNVSDITVMSKKSDFYHLFKKPTYEGDFFTQILDWNINPEGVKDETKKLHASIVKHNPHKTEKLESYDTFRKKVLMPSKYSAKHESRKWKKEITSHLKDWFKDLHEQ